ncbi:hypothetical protein C0989_005659 [Termitomyces sp. Mn162]|nr:hypothetical protein C0989_005659 [Termitomyces sp. Mn162]
MAPLQTDVTPSFLAHNSPPTISPSSASQDADQAFADFMSSLSSPASDVIDEFRTSYNQFGALGNVLGPTDKEEVLRRIDANNRNSDKAPDPVKNAVVPVEGPNHELRKILSDTLPRLFNGLQNFLDERTKAGAD